MVVNHLFIQATLLKIGNWILYISLGLCTGFTTECLCGLRVVFFVESIVNTGHCECF